MKHKQDKMVKGESSPLEYAKFAVVILLIGMGARYLNEGGTQNYLTWFMGLFFIVFASFKFIGYTMFVEAFREYDIIAKRSKIYAYTYPAIEYLLGILFVFNSIPTARNIFTLVIMVVGSIGVARAIKKRSRSFHCACLGNVIKLPLSTVSLAENVGMGLMVIYMLVHR